MTNHFQSFPARNISNSDFAKNWKMTLYPDSCLLWDPTLLSCSKVTCLTGQLLCFSPSQLQKVTKKLFFFCSSRLTTMFVWIIQPLLLLNNNKLKYTNAEIAIQRLFILGFYFWKKKLKSSRHQSSGLKHHSPMLFMAALSRKQTILWYTVAGDILYVCFILRA